ncbi:MAG: PilZ domain-containing protein [Phycisphaerae bacterium]|nr:PilZ domain-containing protein [Phycisphaerae bacterium]
MSRGMTLGRESQRSVLHWAVQRRADLVVSFLAEGGWCHLRSRLIRFDSDRDFVQIAYPVSPGDAPPPEIGPGDELGISFRRGHKKCIFVSPVVMHCPDSTAEGDTIDTLVVRLPAEMRELQRRAYQRVSVPPDRFIAAKVWQGGAPSPDEPTWPLCAGRISNISVGGILLDIRSDQNPRLSVGDMVGLEITVTQGRRPLIVEAQYRHCTMTGPDRIGLGLQLLGLEHNKPGRASIAEIADLVKSVQRECTRRERAERG